MVPLYAARIEDLGPGDFVQVQCIACGHEELLSADQFRIKGVALPPFTLVLDLEPKLRCRECDAKGGWLCLFNGANRTMLSATVDTRYSFTGQFLRSSAIFVRRCSEIERLHRDNIDDPTQFEHRGLVTAAIMQSTAAVEAESAELIMYGPGHHLGSDGVDKQARDFLAPLAAFIDAQQTMERYRLILHLLRKPRLDPGKQPFQHMALLIQARNEITHYNSKWGTEMERQKLFDSLRQLRLQKPPFVAGSGVNFFPHQFMSAACAAWAVRTAVQFLYAVYERLGIESPLKPYLSEFDGI